MNTDDEPSLRGERVFLGLGSNLNDRECQLETTLELLRGVPGVAVGTVSSVYETEPWGVQGQPAYLNVAVEIATTLSPRELLIVVKGIEARLGRCERERWGPREIDIDIILWGERVFETEELGIPHREFRNRAFVLVPLAEIAGGAVDPVTGLTISELTARPEATGRTQRRE